jgi:hypothetical protein
MKVKAKAIQAKTRRFLRKSPFAAPIAGAILLVGAGTTIWWWATRNQFTPGTLPVGANLIPQDALLVMTVNTDPQQWRQLRSFGTTKSQAAIDGWLIDQRDQLFNQNGIDYTKDIAPWVGPEVTIAQLSPQSELADDATEVPSSLSPQPLIAVLPIGDPLRAKAALANPKDLPQRQWTERTYKDIKIREANPTGPNSAATPRDPKNPAPMSQPLQLAVVENRVLVVTNSARSMNQAIDSFREPKKSLVQLPGYANALGQIQQPVRPFLTLYRNVPGSITSAAKNFDRSLPQKTKEWVEQAQGWATVANLKEEGIELRNIAWLKPDSKRRYSPKNEAKNLYKKLPASSLLALSGSDLERFWQDYRRDAITHPVQPLDMELLEKQLQDELGINWQKDFLPWMKGEFALAMVPMPGDAANVMPIGTMILVRTNDRGKAEKAIKQLDDAMISRQNYKVTPGKFNNEAVVNWADPISGLTVTHGWMDGNTIFFSFGSPVTSTFFPQTQTALSEEPKFRKSALASLGQPAKDANGFFFANLEQIFSTSELAPMLAWLEPYRDGGEAIQAIGLNGVTTTDRTQRFDALIQLKPGPNAGPLPLTKPPKSAAPKPEAAIEGQSTAPKSSPKPQ